MTARLRHEMLADGGVRVSLIPAAGPALSVVMGENAVKAACWGMLADLDPDAEIDAENGGLIRTARGAARAAVLAALSKGGRTVDALAVTTRLEPNSIRKILSRLALDGLVTSREADASRHKVWSLASRAGGDR